MALFDESHYIIHGGFVRRAVKTFFNSNIPFLCAPHRLTTSPAVIPSAVQAQISFTMLSCMNIDIYERRDS
jgi:hypothetical protein